MADDLLIGLDALIRSIGINRVTPHALLVGAGASISSGVPSAASCIWEWKRAIFLTRNPGLEVQFAEGDSVTQAIQGSTSSTTALKGSTEDEQFFDKPKAELSVANA